MTKQRMNSSFDAVLLSAIRILSMVVNFASVAVLSRALTVASYGTYSSGEVIVSLASCVTLFGMPDAANYYYNLGDGRRENLINTIVAFQIAFGLFTGFVILFMRGLLSAFFHNPALQGLVAFLAFRPLFVNLSSSLLTLQISVGQARAVAWRNIAFTLLRLAAVLLTALYTKDLRTLLLALLMLEVLTCLYYDYNFRKNEFPLRPWRMRRSLLKPILQFAIPLGIYSMANILIKDLDKLVIGYFDSPEGVAFYANCSATLPLTFVAAAFITVILPPMTRFVQQHREEEARALCRAYLGIGYYTSVTMAAACAVLSPEVVLLLYGEKYVSGVGLFLLYLIVDAIKFANLTMILPAGGKTKTLMRISLGGLAANTVLNLLFYRLIGFAGPAIASVLVSAGVTYFHLSRSAAVIDTSISGILDLPELLRFLAELSGCSLILFLLKKWLIRQFHPHYLLLLAVIGAMFCAAALLFVYRPLRKHMADINRISASAKLSSIERKEADI